MIQVSVVIPTYNRKSRLREALRSVLAQEGVSFEVWVIDDGSTDGTQEMVAKNFPSVHYHYQNNQGPAAARNRGIERSAGKWLAFLDSDDIWEAGKLKAQLQYFKTSPDKFLIAQTEEIWIRRGKRVNPMKKHQKCGGWIFENCLALCMISPSAVMIHRNIFEDVGVFDESYPACEDYELWLRIAAKYPVGYLDKAYVTKYGGHQDQRSREFPAMDQFRIRAMLKILGSQQLSKDQERATIVMLKEKCSIYTKGALKRGNTKDADAMNALVIEAAQKIEHREPIIL